MNVWDSLWIAERCLRRKPAGEIITIERSTLENLVKFCTELHRKVLDTSDEEPAGCVCEKDAGWHLDEPGFATCKNCESVYRLDHVCNWQLDEDLR